MTLSLERHSVQDKRWPTAGRHILAQFDEETIVVYQAYAPQIGAFAIKHQVFGGDFKYSRMSWIKPNFLWMMYRSDWGQSSGQEIVLAIRLRRRFFDQLLQEAVPSTFDGAMYSDEQAWQAAVQQSDVRLQWDPDHLPNGKPCERRAIQLGLRGKALEAYGRKEIVEIVDLTELVAQQRAHVTGGRWSDVVTPLEDVYLPAAVEIRKRIGLDESRSFEPMQ